MPPADLLNAVARHYDEADPFYRALWGEHLHHGLWESGGEPVDEAVIALALRVARAAGLERSAKPRVVDIGCGYGATARLLSERFDAAVTGVTLSPVQHAHAEAMAEAHADVRFVLGDWLRNDLPAASFDAAIAIESTEHMADKPAVFAEAGRVLRPGGRLVVCAWLAAPASTALQRRHLLEPIVSEGRLASLDTADAYAAWIRDAGFTGVAVEDLSARVERTWIICARRVLAELRRPASWRYLLDSARSERIFAVTVLRIMLAFRSGCMRYGLFAAERA